MNKTSLFYEKTADTIVINNLLAEISKLKGEDVMSKIIKSDTGIYYLVRHYEELEPSQVSSKVAELQEELAYLESIAPASEAAPENPVPTIDTVPTPEPQPETPVAPVAPVSEAPATTDVAAPEPTPEVEPQTPVLQ